METNLLTSITQALSSQAAPAISQNLGETESAVHKGLGALLPVLLGGLVAKSATSTGASSVFSTVTGQNVDTGLLGNLGSLLGSGQSSNVTNVGGSLLSGIFGADKTSGLGGALASISGMKAGSAVNLVMMAVPLVFGQLKKVVTERGLNVSSFSSLLAGQKEHLLGKLDPTLTSALGLGSPASFLGGAAAPVRATAAAVAATGPAAAAGLSRYMPWLIGFLIALALLWYFMGRGPSTTREVTTTTSGAAASVRFPAKVYFETGKAEIGSESSAVIKSAAAELARSSSKVELTGYTDKTGDSAANQELAKSRALAVKAALEAAGVGADRIESKPPVFVEIGAAGGDAEARRVDIGTR